MVEMINFSVVNLADKLEEIKDIEGKVKWNNVSTITDQI
jgi:small subunit ribosomal protein S6